MEIEYFVKPEDGAAMFDTWLGEMKNWVERIGLNPDHLRIREHDKEELSHYSSRTVDFEYLFPGSMGWRELYGLANRTDYDLKQHQEFSGEDMRYFEQDTGKRFIPHVIEPTFGVERTFLVVLLDAYDEEETVDVNGKADTRVVLRLAPVLAPCKAAVLPLMKKPELTEIARAIFEEIQNQTDFVIDYDETANIGKRYRRQDEIGTPFCFTVDYESLDDKQVTVRHRDSMEQHRIAISEVVAFLQNAIR